MRKRRVSQKNRIENAWGIGQERILSVIGVV